MELETARLRLREFVIDDVDALYEMESDPEVLHYVTYGPSTRADCIRDIEFHIAQQTSARREIFHLAVTQKPYTRCIGWCGIAITNTRHREGEIGYALALGEWNNGFATEAAAAVLDFAFHKLMLHRIFATTHPENQASQRVLGKLGMQLEGVLRGNKWQRTAWRDSNLYAILAEEWQGQHVG